MNVVINIGIDVHKDFYSLCSNSFATKQAFGKTRIASDSDLVIKYVRKLQGAQPNVEILCGYEAGPTGYSLYRDLEKTGVGRVGGKMFLPYYHRDKDRNLVINEQEAETVRKIFSWYEQDWSIVRIKKELETLRIPSPRGKRRWAVRTIIDMLSNEKYAGDSAYGKIIIAEYPSMRQIKNSPDKVSRSENHHSAVIDKVLFDRVQEMKRIRTNVEIDEKGNKARKITHYSIKHQLDMKKDQTAAEET